MKTRLLLSAIVAITIVASIGFGLGPGQKMTTAFADDNDKKSTGSSIPSVPPYAHTPFYATFVNHAGIPAFTSSSGMCMQGTFGTGSGVLPTYTFPMGVNAYDPSLGGNPSTFTGWCVAESDTYGNSDPCYVANGIAWYGLCEPGISGAGYNQTSTSPPNIPTEEWFHLNGVVLQPGQYLDVADTTPWETTKGHMAMVLPCDVKGTPLVRLYQGIIDGGVFTMEAPPVQYLQQLSDPKNGICVYHFDVGANNKANGFGVTDFALINVSNHRVEFTDRNTSTFSIAEGFLNLNS